MGCLLAIVGLLLPRVAIVLVFLFTRWLQSAFATWIWPVLGFIFLPYTTLAYTAGAVNTGGNLTAGWIILIVVAVIADVANWGGGYRVRRRKVTVARR
jgi:hypothetical protein